MRVIDKSGVSFDVPDSQTCDVYLQFAYVDGEKRPIQTMKVLGDGNIVRTKSVMQPDGATYKEYFQKKDGEWQEFTDEAEPGTWLIRGIGSSEVVDMDGDIMTKSALESMCLCSKTLNTFIGHNIDDDHLFGSLQGAPILTYRDPDDRGTGLIKADKGYAAVEIESDVETENWRAVRSYKYIRKGREFGFSVGCFYIDASPRIVNGRQKGAVVKEVAVAEWSVVTLPSNQQSWIEECHKSLVRKGVLLPTETDVARAENLYRMRNFRDYPPAVARRLERLADHLKTAGIYLATPYQTK